MMRKFAVLFLFLPLLVSGQGNEKNKKNRSQGVFFKEGLSWEEIKKEARRENKLIFVDCFATWCNPCKKMDEEVYKNDTVGNFFNSHFISFKLQMDKTRKDNDSLRAWYPLVDSFFKKYRIRAYPTFLFFSAEGDGIHEVVGYRNVSALIHVAREAIDPKRQYYTLIKKYQEDKIDLESIKRLAISAQKNGDDSLSSKLANEYLNDLSPDKLYTKDNIDFIKQFVKLPRAQLIAKDYKLLNLDKLNHSVLCQKENLTFILTYPDLINSKDSFFYLFYYFPHTVDSIVGIEVSENLVKYTISKEEIYSKLWANGNPVTLNPKWNKICKNIQAKYGRKYVALLVPDAQMNFYRRIENWDKYVKVIQNKIRKNEPRQDGKSLFIIGDAFILNSWAWDMFLHCDSKKYLRTAIGWSDRAIKLVKDSGRLANDYDTKANLLYKLGRVKDAIALDKIAVELSPSDKEIQEALTKMKRGEPTWINARKGRLNKK